MEELAIFLLRKTFKANVFSAINEKPLPFQVLQRFLNRNKKNRYHQIPLAKQQGNYSGNVKMLNFK